MNFNTITNFLVHKLDHPATVTSEAEKTIEAGLEALQEGDNYKALNLLKPVATAGNTFAQTLLGAIYRELVSMPHNYEESARWFTLACGQDYPLAQLQLALMYLHGLGVDQSEDLAKQYLIKAAQSGNASAQFELGNFHARGYLGVVDAAEAAKWYKLSADQYFSPAIRALTVLLAKGEGVPRDIDAVIALCDRAAHNGDVDSLLVMAEFHMENGEEISDFRPAVKCLEQAAKLGSAQGQYRLAQLYLTGIGVQRNEKKAVKLLTRASENGDEKAQKELAEILEQEKAARAMATQIEHVPPPM